MIQRKQSIFIGVAIILCIVMFFLPFAEFLPQGKDLSYYAAGVADAAGKYLQINYTIIVLLTVTLLFCLFSLFTYKKRLLQIKISNFALLLNMIFIVVVFFLIDHTAKGFFGNASSTVLAYKYTLVFPLVNIILLFLAIRAIKKDEAMVRASDRLR